MDIYKETFETWNKVALLYQEKFMHLEIYNDTYDLFCNSINKDNPTILEVGCGPGNISKYILSNYPNYCGPGNISKYILSNYPNYCVEGIDFAPNMVELARKNNPAATYQVLDCRNIHEIKNKYDGIICGFCLPYISENESMKLFSDVSTLLNKNGSLYLSFVEGEYNKSGFLTSSTGDRTYFYYYELDKVVKHLIEHGFDVPQVYKVNYRKNDSNIENHTILITKKNSY